MKRKFFAFFAALLVLSARVYSQDLPQAFDTKSPNSVLMDASSGKILFEKAGEEVKPATSIMKLMNLLLAMEAIEKGKITNGDMVSISETAAKAPGANVWLKENESVSVEDLMKSVAMVSANDAAMALAEHIAGTEGKFLSMMNEKSVEIGMKNTVFKDCLGTDEDGNVSSAKDIALLSRALLKYKEINQYTSSWIDHIRGGSTQIVNTNKIIKIYSGAFGLKTGTTEKAGSCISAAATKNGMTLVAVILDAKDSKERFADACALLDFGFSSFVTVQPALPEDFPETIKVKNSMVAETPIFVDIHGGLSLQKGQEKNVNCEYLINEEITAPLENGTQIGEVTFKLGEQVLAMYPILTETNTEEIAFAPLFKKLFFAFFAL